MLNNVPFNASKVVGYLLNMHDHLVLILSLLRNMDNMRFAILLTRKGNYCIWVAEWNGTVLVRGGWSVISL